MNFPKFVRTPFLQNICGWLLLLRLKCNLKLWLQRKRIYSPLLTNLIWNTAATTAENLKFHSKWAVSIYCPPPAYKNWLLICETVNKWHMCKSVYMEVCCGRNELFWDAWLVPFFPRKKIILNSLERTCCFWKQKRTLLMVHSQSCFCTIFILIENLPMQNELTFAS